MVPDDNRFPERRGYQPAVVANAALEADAAAWPDDRVPSDRHEGLQSCSTMTKLFGRISRSSATLALELRKLASSYPFACASATFAERCRLTF
ncbi:MAG: hypothetical protein JWO80_3143 [Bryobacterales bacterium]|nr:hypothetical protein [Bryobacterales bacterium]